MRDTLLDQNKNGQNHDFIITFKFTMRKLPHFKNWGNIVHAPSVSLFKVLQLYASIFAHSKILGSVNDKVTLWGVQQVFVSQSLVSLCLFAWHSAATEDVIRRVWLHETGWGFVLWHAGAAEVRRAHLSEHLVQPLQGAVEMQLYPAGGAGYCLPPAGRKIWVTNVLPCLPSIFNKLQTSQEYPFYIIKGNLDMLDTVC